MSRWPFTICNFYLFEFLCSYFGIQVLITFSWYNVSHSSPDILCDPRRQPTALFPFWHSNAFLDFLRATQTQIASAIAGDVNPWSLSIVIRWRGTGLVRVSDSLLRSYPVLNEMSNGLSFVCTLRYRGLKTLSPGPPRRMAMNGRFSQLYHSRGPGVCRNWMKFRGNNVSHESFFGNRYR